MNEIWTDQYGLSNVIGPVKITNLNAESHSAGTVIMSNGDNTAQWAKFIAGTGIAITVDSATGQITIGQTGTYSGAITGISLNINGGAMTVDGSGNITMASGSALAIGSVASINNAGAIVGTSLNVGPNGTISGGQITGSSLNVGSGSIQFGSLIMQALDLTTHQVAIVKNPSTGQYELQIAQ